LQEAEKRSDPLHACQRDPSFNAIRYQANIPSIGLPLDPWIYLAFKEYIMTCVMERFGMME
jgi:hypothetical protein